MPLLWCSISGHGFGHAAQVAPVLNALGRLVPDLRVILRTSVPESFFRVRLTIPYDYRPAQQDIGCIQQGPLHIDVPGTWKALTEFHATWEQRVEADAGLMTTLAPDLCLSDISYLAFAAAHRAGVRSLALASLAWDEIMEGFVESGTAAQEPQEGLIAQMRHCYGLAAGLIRLAPAMPLRAFPAPHDVGAIVEPIEAETQRLRERLHATDDERIVLVGFGGISLTSLPYAQMERMDGYRFLVDGSLPQAFTRLHSAQDLGMRFMTLLASCDLVMTKPGYSTIVEAVDKRKPVLYVRRYNFGDEQSIVDYLHRHGRGLELSLADFDRGAWRAPLDRLTGETAAHPLPTPPATGTEAAAALCAEYLARR